MRQTRDEGNSNTSDYRMPRIHRIKNSDTRKAKNLESIREYPIYKILKFAVETERWKAREPD